MIIPDIQSVSPIPADQALSNSIPSDVEMLSDFFIVSIPKYFPEYQLMSNAKQSHALRSIRRVTAYIDSVVQYFKWEDLALSCRNLEELVQFCGEFL